MKPLIVMACLVCLGCERGGGITSTLIYPESIKLVGMNNQSLNGDYAWNGKGFFTNQNYSIDLRGVMHNKND